MNIDKTRKVVSIVLMVLMIGTMVFNAFHIVGHCASESSGFYLPYVCSYSKLPSYSADIEAVELIVLNYVNTLGSNNYSSLNDFDGYILGRYSEDNGVQYFTYAIWNSVPDFYLYSDSNGTVSTSVANAINSSSNRIYLTSERANDFKYYRVVYQNNVLSSNLIGTYGSLTLPLPTTIYPFFYCNKPIIYTDDIYGTPTPDPGVVIFSMQSGSDSPGHSKGGTLTEYTYDQTDEPAPSDPSAVAGSGGWLSKILGGLNKLNKTVGDGFTNLVDNLQSFFNPIFGAFEQQIDNFKSSIESKLDDIILALGGDLPTNDTSLSDTFLTAFQGSKTYGVVTTYNQGKQLVTGLFNAVPTPQTLRFEFDLPTMNLSGGHSQGGSSSPNAVKPYGNKLVMDFGWYDNIRSIVVPFIIAWLYVGMLVWLLRAIPGFISGSPSFNTRSISNGSPIVNNNKGGTD